MGETTRRKFLGYLLAGSTLTAASSLVETPLWGIPRALAGPLGSLGGVPTMAGAAAASGLVPSGPQPSDVLDLNDILTAATLPTANLITVVVNTDGSVSFAIPRTEMGQGITTSSAMLIAEEMDLPLDKVHVTLADARPELVFNQATFGSNTTISTFTPIRVAAAIAKQSLLAAAAAELGDTVNNLIAKGGHILSSTGALASIGDLATKAAVSTNQAVTVALKAPSSFKVIGTPRKRIDALDAVTGRKQFAMDLAVPGALPAMICRPPTINGTVRAVANLAAVKAMPGVTDVGVISTGVAVRGHTFGQCIDAVRALQVSWGPGSVDGLSDDNVLAAVKAAELPLAIPPADPLAATIEGEFTFYWHDNSALEPLTAVADVRPDRAEIWAAMQTPILAQQTIAQKLGLPVSAVTAHVVNAGGAFGRRMFTDVMVEAAEISKLFGKPVKLMWHRTDEFRVGRVHPLCTSRIRATYTKDSVLTFEQRHTSVATDYTQGFGEILDSSQAKLPGLNFLEFSQTVFETTVNVPYNFGAVTQLLNETYNFDTFHSGSVRNLYSPDVVTAIELVVDQLAAKMGQDAYSFRRTFAKDDRARAVLDKVAEVGNWGRTMAPGTAQGIALHPEYKGFNAALVEIDARPATVGRSIPDAVAGPRVTKVVFAVDVGLAVNPLGLQAQMLGGITEGIGQVLTESLHLKDGNFLEGSWDNYFFTRQWNSPLDVQIIVMPPTTGTPGGAGEFGVGTSKAAVACAYARATGTVPTSFPINHDGPLAFTPYPTVPPIPQSPTDGLQHAY
jgi:isoquinoline 1-oxidoreductase beta subunit